MNDKYRFDQGKLYKLMTDQYGVETYVFVYSDYRVTTKKTAIKRYEERED